MYLGKLSLLLILFAKTVLPFKLIEISSGFDDDNGKITDLSCNSQHTDCTSANNFDDTSTSNEISDEINDVSILNLIKY